MFGNPKPRISQVLLFTILANLTIPVIEDNSRGYVFISDSRPDAIFYKSLRDIEREIKQKGYRCNGIFKNSQNKWTLCIPYSC